MRFARLTSKDGTQTAVNLDLVELMKADERARGYSSPARRMGCSCARARLTSWRGCPVMLCDDYSSKSSKMINDPVEAEATWTVTLQIPDWLGRLSAGGPLLVIGVAGSVAAGSWPPSLRSLA